MHVPLKICLSWEMMEFVTKFEGLGVRLPQWNEIDFRVKIFKRLVELKVHYDGFKLVYSMFSKELIDIYLLNMLLQTNVG